MQAGSRFPIDERFFIGGATTVRSFGERQLGPYDQHTGQPIGGEAYTIVNVEYVFPSVLADLRGAVFFDAGNLRPRAERLGSATSGTASVSASGTICPSALCASTTESTPTRRRTRTSEHSSELRGGVLRSIFGQSVTRLDQTRFSFSVILSGVFSQSKDLPAGGSQEVGPSYTFHSIWQLLPPAAEGPSAALHSAQDDREEKPPTLPQKSESLIWMNLHCRRYRPNYNRTAGLIMSSALDHRKCPNVVLPVSIRTLPDNPARKRSPFGSSRRIISAS